MKRHIIIGVSASVLLLLVYMGIITLAEGIEHALDQTATLWYWVTALVIGFGIQAGLFSFIRHGLRERRTSATASVATSGGVSAGSMAACWAAFLASYQVLFIIIGVLSNVVGITIMLESIQRHGLSRKLTHWRWNIGWLKKGAMVSAVLVIGVMVFRTLLLP